MLATIMTLVRLNSKRGMGVFSEGRRLRRLGSEAYTRRWRKDACGGLLERGFSMIS